MHWNIYTTHVQKSSPTCNGTPRVPSSGRVSQDGTYGVLKHLGADVHVFVYITVHVSLVL